MEHDNKCPNCKKYCEEMDLIDSPEYQMSVCAECAESVKNEQYVECRNYVNCGGFALNAHELCENCIVEQNERESDEETLQRAMRDLKEALNFVERTRKASSEERAAVRSDHLKELENAAKKAVEAYF